MILNCPRRRSRRGLSMVESLLAVTITAVAGGALLSSIGASVQSSSDTAHAAVARGLAAQLMDEMAAMRFPESTNSVPGGTGRENFDDLDDYAGYSMSPPVDRAGEPLGTDGGPMVLGSPGPRAAELQGDADFLAPFGQEVTVERVTPSGGSWTVGPAHTNYRRVTVRITYTDARAVVTTLAETSRIFTYVPFAP